MSVASGSPLAFSNSRRQFLGWAAASGAVALSGLQATNEVLRQAPPGERPEQHPSVTILHPKARVPASFFIDDSTCLVNMGHFCMPQFATAWPERPEYNRPWSTWPREIPDSFVREFGEWCHAHGVKGKYSIVPYPACVGWLDRELPGWSKRQLQDSLKLVREFMLPDWDIHPEMITHTRVIDLKTGRPLEEISSATMENSYPQKSTSTDYLASYIAYALRVLKNCDLPCEGITTPGGFGNSMKPELSIAIGQAVRDVFAPEVPHYFKYVRDGAQSTLPVCELVSGLSTGAPQFVVNLPAGTGDWFGGWDGDRVSEGHKYANADATGGRMVELIERNEPAVMLCHWAGLFSHGTKAGFKDFQRVILALEQRYPDRLNWMKITELARYGAARELTTIRRDGPRVLFQAPVRCPDFTVRLPVEATPPVTLTFQGQKQPLKEINNIRLLSAGQWVKDGERIVACFDLPKGESSLGTV